MKTDKATRMRFASKIFVKSVFVLLLLTSTSKLVMSFGTAEVLIQPAPAIFGFMLNKDLLVLGSVLELSVILLYFLAKSTTTLLISIAALSTVFALYKICLWISGFHGYCECLGSVTDILRINQQQSVAISDGILVYLLIGSYTFLLLKAFKSETIHS